MTKAKTTFYAEGYDVTIEERKQGAHTVKVISPKALCPTIYHFKDTTKAYAFYRALVAEIEGKLYGRKGKNKNVGDINKLGGKSDGNR